MVTIDSLFDFWLQRLSREQRFVRERRENSGSLDADFQFATLTCAFPPMWSFSHSTPLQFLLRRSLHYNSSSPSFSSRPPSLYLTAAHSFKSNKWHSIHTIRATDSVQITCENFNFNISLLPSRRDRSSRRPRFTAAGHPRHHDPFRDARSFLTPTNCQRLVKCKKYKWSVRGFYHA